VTEEQVRSELEALGLSWKVHLLDSLAALPSVRREMQARGWSEPQVLDVGSGAGLPGLLWAVMQPTWHITCVDTVAKKMAFVQQTAAAMRRVHSAMQITAKHIRAEALQAQAYHLITARAFAPLPKLVQLTRMALAPGGVWAALKGEAPDQEIAALPEDIQVFHVEPLPSPQWGAARCMVWMQNPLSRVHSRTWVWRLIGRPTQPPWHTFFVLQTKKAALVKPPPR
jgi:16S rRNA (guanine527-N7)-methyltransferase